MLAVVSRGASIGARETAAAAERHHCHLPHKAINLGETAADAVGRRRTPSDGVRRRLFTHSPNGHSRFAFDYKLGIALRIPSRPLTSAILLNLARRCSLKLPIDTGMPPTDGIHICGKHQRIWLQAEDLLESRSTIITCAR